MTDPQLSLFGPEPDPEPEAPPRRRWPEFNPAVLRSPARNRAIWEDTHGTGGSDDATDR